MGEIIGHPKKGIRNALAAMELRRPAIVRFGTIRHESAPTRTNRHDAGRLRTVRHDSTRMPSAPLRLGPISLTASRPAS